MRTNDRLLLVLLAVTLAACGGGSKDKQPQEEADPVPLEDQGFTAMPRDTALGIGDVDCAQTFITAAAGQLTSVRLTLSAPAMAMGMLRVDVRPAPGGVPDEDDGAALGFVEIDVSTLGTTPTVVPFDLTDSNIMITASTSLAIVARRVAGMGDVATIHGGSAGGYGNGSAYRRGGMTWASSAPLDFEFRTFVLP